MGCGCGVGFGLGIGNFSTGVRGLFQANWGGSRRWLLRDRFGSSWSGCRNGIRVDRHGRLRCHCVRHWCRLSGLVRLYGCQLHGFRSGGRGPGSSQRGGWSRGGTRKRWWCHVRVDRRRTSLRLRLNRGSNRGYGGVGLRHVGFLGSRLGSAHGRHGGQRREEVSLGCGCGIEFGLGDGS